MTLNSFKMFLYSFKYAGEGILWALKTQRNLKVHFIIAIIVLLLANILGIPTIELILLLVCITIVIFSEMVNSAIEVIIDVYFKDEYSIQAKVTKDVAAGAVLIIAIGVACVGILIFIPKIFMLLVK